MKYSYEDYRWIVFVIARSLFARGPALYLNQDSLGVVLVEKRLPGKHHIPKKDATVQVGHLRGAGFFLNYCRTRKLYQVCPYGESASKLLAVIS